MLIVGMAIASLILKSIVLWVASIITPETIMFTDTKSLIITVLMAFVAGIILGIPYLIISTILTGLNEGISLEAPSLAVITSIISFFVIAVLGVLSDYLSLFLVDKLYTGFTVTNTLHLILLSIVFSFTNVNRRKKRGLRGGITR